MPTAEHSHREHPGQATSGLHHPLAWALALTLGFAAVEAAGGWWSGSLALLSDAGHMLSDALALGLALLAAWIARMPPSHNHSYGLVRAEVMAALANGLVMVGVVIFIVVEAVDRLQGPRAVAGGAVMAIAFVGLLINMAVMFVLSRGGDGGINIRAVTLHVMGDLLGSVAALTAGAVIYFTGWMPIDPILSLVVALLILGSTVNVLRGAFTILMEGVPAELQLETVGREMAHVEGVRSVHDLHIWTLSSGRVVLSAHLELEDLGRWPQILGRMRAMLREHYGIEHVTLQPEVTPHIEQPYQAKVTIHPTKR